MSNYTESWHVKSGSLIGGVLVARKKKAGHNNGVDWKISRRYLLYGSPSILSPLTSTYFLYIRLLIVRFAGLGETILTKIDRSIRCAINLSSFSFFLSNKNTKKISFFSYIAKRKIRKMKKKKKRNFYSWK